MSQFMNELVSSTSGTGLPTDGGAPQDPLAARSYAAMGRKP
jgi:hypothetical protein